MSIDINIAKKEIDLGFVFCGGAFLIVPLLHSNHIKYETPPQTRGRKQMFVYALHMTAGLVFSNMRAEKRRKKENKECKLC